MSGKNCPLCGKEITTEDKFCQSCQDTARAREDELDLRLKTVEVINPKEDEKQIQSKEDSNKYKISKKTIVTFVIILILFTGAGITAALVSRSNKLSRDNETAYWERCIATNTPLAYSKYLVTFPEGIYKNDAENRILAIREAENKLWNRTKATNSTDSISYFLSDYPDSPYKREAIQIIDSLAWIRTLEDNTADAYKAYIENVSLENYTGIYLEDAKTKYDYLSTIIVLEGDELVEFKEYLNQIAQNLASEREAELKKILQTDTIPNFLGQKNKSIHSILDSLKDNNKKQKIKDLNYEINTKDLYVTQDRDSIRNTTLPYKKQITYTDRKKKIVVENDTIKLQFNQNRLQAVYK